MQFYTEYDSPVGILTLASNGDAICGLWIEGQKYHGGKITGSLVSDDKAGGFAEMRAWLDSYFEGGTPAIESVPLAPTGSDFQKVVWKHLTDIPYGKLTTYGAIAESIKKERGRSSALAVGGAVAHNPISIIVPCHRVVGANGSLTGYAGGIKRKIWLLEHEGADMGKLFVSKKGTAL